MIFYHGTSEKVYKEILDEGILYGKRGYFEGKLLDRCTYLAVDKKEAEQYGKIVLQVEYNPYQSTHNNYKEGCWQFRVYEPISIENIKRL